MLRESDETSIIRDIWTFLCQSVGMYRRNNMPSDNRAYRKLAGFYKRKTAKNYIMQSFMSLRHRIWLCLRAANHVSLTQHPFQKKSTRFIRTKKWKNGHWILKSSFENTTVSAS